MADRLVGNCTKGSSTTIAANKISVVIASPGTGYALALKNIHMQVDIADGGSGIVTYRIIRNATATRWYGTWTTDQGCWFDCTAVCDGNPAESMTLEVERTGFTSGVITYEVATMQVAP